LNIGLGLLLLPLALSFISMGIISRKKLDKLIVIGLFSAGIIVLLGCVVLLTGLYDPYFRHLQ
jgi:hypothetical protein